MSPSSSPPIAPWESGCQFLPCHISLYDTVVTHVSRPLTRGREGTTLLFSPPASVGFNWITIDSVLFSIDVEEPDNEAEEEVEGEDSEAHEEPEAPEMQEETRGSLIPEESEAEVPEAEHEPEPGYTWLTAVCVSACAYMCVHTCMSEYAWVYECMQVWVCVCTYVCICTFWLVAIRGQLSGAQSVNNSPVRNWTFCCLMIDPDNLALNIKSFLQSL